MKNKIIGELRRMRDSHAQQHNFDIEAMARDLMQLDPWMERRTYINRNGNLVTVASLRKRDGRRKTLRASGKNRT